MDVATSKNRFPQESRFSLCFPPLSSARSRGSELIRDSVVADVSPKSRQDQCGLLEGSGHQHRGASAAVLYSSLSHFARSETEIGRFAYKVR